MKDETSSEEMDYFKDEITESLILEENSFPEISNEELTSAISEIESVGKKVREKKITKKDYKDFNDLISQTLDIGYDKLENKLTIPTGIDLLDAVLGGGFAIGTLGMIVGAPGSGKSMLAAQVLGNSQTLCDKKMSTYLDTENAMTKLRLGNLGVRRPPKEPYSRDLTLEKIFTILELMCVAKEEQKLIDEPVLLIWDSIANTLTKKEMETDDPNSVIGYKARLLSLLIPKYVAKLAKYNICFLTINQLRDQISMGNPYQQPRKELKFISYGKTIPGGAALKYNAFQLLEMNIKSVITEEKYGFNGILSDVRIIKNKLFPPNIVVNIAGDYVRGFSNFWTNFIFLVESKKIQTGSWNYLITAPEKKFRTKDALETYETDEGFKLAFDELAKASIQKDIIERYNPILFDESDIEE